MSYSPLNFSTGSIVNPFAGLQESVGAGSIFAKILTANDEQKQQDKILAERAAERDEAKAERAELFKYQQGRDSLVDSRYDKTEAEKLRTNDLVDSYTRDMTPEGMGTTLTPEQVGTLEKVNTGNSVADGKTVTDMYNKFVADNKSNPAHAIKMADTIDYGKKYTTDGKEIQGDNAKIFELKSKLNKNLTDDYSMNLHSNMKPGESINDLAKRYTKETGQVMPASAKKDLAALMKTKDPKYVDNTYVQVEKTGPDGKTEIKFVPLEEGKSFTQNEEFTDGKSTYKTVKVIDMSKQDKGLGSNDLSKDLESIAKQNFDKGDWFSANDQSNFKRDASTVINKLQEEGYDFKYRELIEAMSSVAPTMSKGGDYNGFIFSNEGDLQEKVKNYIENKRDKKNKTTK